MTVLPSYHLPVADKLECIVSEPIDIAGLLSRSHHPKAGAVVLFSGDVRDNNQGREVAWLEYEAHLTLATKMIREILEEATRRWQLTLAVAQHRVGKVPIGE